MISPLKVYHRLPASGRSIAASLRGYYLRSWRYGPETAPLVAEALEREQWSPDRWRVWQEERMTFVLNHAATKVPYYREQWAARRRRGDRRSWAYLENWPVLEKEAVRMQPLAFLADDCVPARMFHEHTSGTTGKPLDLWWSLRTVRQWYALFEARCRQWHGVSRRDRWVMLGGQVVVPVTDRKPPFWTHNVAFHQLYMSSYHLAPDLIPDYLDAIARFRPRYALGYSSSLYELAHSALHLGRRDLGFEAIVTNAEPLFPYQRQIIEQAFQCPVRETYGMAEVVANASECEAGGLHLWPEVGWIELLENEHPVADGAAGDLICTGLLNVEMPLVRYRVGDRASRPPRHVDCACGRQLPLLAAVEGRADDTLYTRDGRPVGRLDTIFKSSLPIVEAQIVQETLERVRVRFVPAADFTVAAGGRIIDELRARMGDIEVVLDPVSSIPRTQGGKFRAVVCNVGEAEIGQSSRRATVAGDR
jgi:phenylacetate-CoA ligase